MRINPVKIFQQSDNKFLFLVPNFFIITAPTFDPLKMIKLKKKKKKKKKKTKPQVVKILIYICRKKIPHPMQNNQLSCS